jgi:hypothetical protein
MWSLITNSETSCKLLAIANFFHHTRSDHPAPASSRFVSGLEGDCSQQVQ